MFVARTATAAVMLIALAGCVTAGDEDLLRTVAIPDGGGDASCGAPVDFPTEITPIFESRCALSGCHGPPASSAAAAMVLAPDSAYEAIVGVSSLSSAKKRVEPGDPASSFLYDRITASNGSSRMPPIGDPLSADEIALVRCWIEQGATKEATP